MTLQIGIRLSLLGGALGVVIGLLRSLAEILAHDYFNLGFLRTAGEILAAQVLAAFAIGFICALILCVGTAIACALVPPLRALTRPDTWLEDLRRRIPNPWVLLFGLWACLMLVLAASHRYHVLNYFTVSRIVLATIVAILVYLSARLYMRSAFAARRPTFSRALVIAALITGVAVGCELVSSGLYLFEVVGVRTGLRRLLLPVLFLTFLLTLFQDLHHLGRWEGGRPRQGRWPDLLSPGTSILLMVAAVLAAMQVVPVFGNRREGRSVVIIAIDTLREGRTTLLGVPEDGRDLTPNLRRLAQRGGTVFSQAISQAPWTMPSFASVLTGLYPHEHRAISLDGFLSHDQTTLAEVAREAGLETGAVVSHAYVNSSHGFAQGFDIFDEDNDLGHNSVTSGAVTDRAIEILDSWDGEDFFLFVHYFDPHYEYLDHEAWSYSDDYAGWLLNQPMDYRNLLGKRHLLQAGDIGFLRDRYDEEIAFTDRAVGRLLDRLEEPDLDRSVMIIGVADHGEEFMERGWIGHTSSLFDELVHVPLIVSPPPSGGEVSATPVETSVVETRSVYSTVLDYLDIETALPSPPPSLLHLPSEEVASARDPGEAYSTVWLPDAPLDLGLRVRLTSVRTDRWKLIHDFTRHRVMLFDLLEDPGENMNRARDRRDVLEELFLKLESWGKRVGIERSDTPTFDPSEEVKRKLQALGYL